MTGGFSDFSAAAVEELVAGRIHRDVPPPGLDPQLRAPFSDDDLNTHLPPSGDRPPRLAAVLVPLVARAPEVKVLLTRRTDEMPTHAGQVAFPGGKIDRGDPGALGAALRETEEETGLARRFVRPIGYLDAYQTRTGFRVVPVVAMVDEGFDVVPEPGEVAEVFEVPLRFLMDPANHRLDSRIWQGVERTFHAMPYGRHYIWGATAGILHSFYRRVFCDE